MASSSKPFAGAESGSPGRALEAGKRGSPGRAVQAGIRGKRLTMDLREDKNAIKRFLAIFSGSSSSLTLLDMIKQNDREAKLKMKRYADASHRSKPSNLQLDDRVLNVKISSLLRSTLNLTQWLAERDR